MKKIWKVIGVIVLVFALIGAICVGIGLFTGADAARIYSIVDKQFNIGQLINGYRTQVNQIMQNAASLL